MGKKELIIANRRIKKLREQFELDGSFVLDNSIFGAGVDIIVIQKEGRIKAYEVTNLAEKTVYDELEYVKEDKTDRYIKSLNKFDKLKGLGYEIEKTLIISFASSLNEEQFRRLKENHIHVQILGYQD